MEAILSVGPPKSLYELLLMNAEVGQSGIP